MDVDIMQSVRSKRRLTGRTGWNAEHIYRSIGRPFFKCEMVELQNANSNAGGGE